MYLYIERVYYKTKWTTVYVTFLDANNTFDRIDHLLLFDKMIKMGVPLFIIKLLIFWYSRLRMFVSWGNTCSAIVLCYKRCQAGRYYLTILFNLYMDDFSVRLNCSGIGGYIGTSFINHVCCAVALCPISLFFTGMQHLHNICKEYASTHQLLYNVVDQSHLHYVSRKTYLKSVIRDFI